MQDLSNNNVAKKAHTEETSAVVRHLGFIKGLVVIMAVLIVVVFSVIVVTIYSRLTKDSGKTAASEIKLVLPKGAQVRAASPDKSGMVLLIDMPAGQQIWRLTHSGEVTQKTIVQASQSEATKSK